MNESNEQRTTLVMKDVSDADGTMWRAVHLSASNELIIEGHDLGPGVDRVFGCGEYEFQRALSSNETSELRKLLGLSGDQDLLAAITERFDDTTSLEAFLKAHDLDGKFWNRVGD